MKTPMPYGEDGGQNMKELITTEKFYTEEELKKNPYLFESEEFVMQKYIEKK
jgi:hypothetical protein